MHYVLFFLTSSYEDYVQLHKSYNYMSWQLCAYYLEGLSIRGKSTSALWSLSTSVPQNAVVGHKSLSFSFLRLSCFCADVNMLGRCFVMKDRSSLKKKYQQNCQGLSQSAYNLGVFLDNHPTLLYVSLLQYDSAISMETIQAFWVSLFMQL